MRNLTVVPAACLLLFTSCQQPANTVFHGTSWPRSISRMSVTGEATRPVVAGVICEDLAVDQQAGILYSANETSIRRWTFDGKSLGGFDLPKHGRAMALDARGGHLFVAEERNSHDIVRFDADGGNRTVIVPDARYCAALAFDGKRRTLYWSRIHPNGIWRANEHGGEVRQIATVTRTSNAIAVDECGRRLFWFSPGFPTDGGRIMVADLDGGNARALLTGLPWEVEGIAVDPVAGRIYWAERHSGNAKPARIRSAKLDGTDERTLREFSGTDHATTIALARTRE
jgi:hypothetical protein